MQTIKQLSKIGVGAIIIGLTVTYVLAWTGPPGNPPTPNADAPITVSGTGQTKAGGLWLNTNGAPFGLIVDKGYVGIGTTTPNNLLQVSGLINFPNDKFGTFLGYQAGNVNTGDNNTFVGYQSGLSNTTGNYNSVMGNSAFYSNITGNYNAAMGNRALSFNIAGSANSAMGYNAGRYQNDGTTPLQTANNSVYIGYNSKGFNNSDNNSIVIGADAVGIGANSVVLGNNNILTTALKGNVGIGTTIPQGALDVVSTTGAFIVPRMTTAQRDALTAVNGMIIYNTTTNQFNFREVGAWVLK